MKLFSKKMLVITLIMGISFSFMSFKGGKHSNFGSANEVSTSYVENIDNTNKVAFTALVRVVGRYVVRGAVSVARALSRYTPEMEINTAFTLAIAMNDKNIKSQIAFMDELKEVEYASIN